MTKVIKSYSSSLIITTEKLKKVNNNIIIINLQWHIHVSADLDKNKSTIHVTLVTQVYTLDRPCKNR